MTQIHKKVSALGKTIVCAVVTKYGCNQMKLCGNYSIAPVILFKKLVFSLSLSSNSTGGDFLVSFCFFLHSEFGRVS